MKMNNFPAFFVVISILVTVTSSAPEFGFKDIIGVFTSAPTATPTPSTASPQVQGSYNSAQSSTTKASTSTPQPTFASTSAPTAQTNSPALGTSSPAAQTSSSTASAQTATQSSLAGAMDGTFTIGSATTAVSTIESTFENWVGPVTTPSDTACYREAHIASSCPLEFDSKVESCWAQCPLTFPVSCGMECIRQNDDCKLEIVTKVSVVFQSAMSLATFGLYGEFKLMAKGVQTAFKCAKEMAGLVRQLTKYVRTVQVSNPETAQDKLLTMLYQTDNVVFDLPVTICACLGIKVADQVKFADKITNTAELVLKEVVVNANAIVSSWDSFKSFMTNISLGEPISSLQESDITSLQSALKSNTSCGYDMKRLADRVWMTVAALRQQNPEISENDLRVAMSKSTLVLNEIPVVTNNCMEELIAASDEATAYVTRSTLRKTFSGIVEDLITSGTSSNGTYLAAEEYAYKIADKAASFYGVWDVTGVANVIAEYFQTICGPTKFIGDIDDGTAEKALGMTMAGDAFNGSTGSWTKQGDGAVTITFQSSDTDDVTVNIQSGGDKIDEVEVPAGGSATWSSNVTALGGKTLYLDRWRPGVLGLPGTGGGSLMLWVPRATQSGGHLELTAMLNVS